jgi:alginate O-acetyltransferase complex protein AlgI
MGDQLVDVAGSKFWLAFCLAVIVLTPLRSPKLRPWVWAGVNVVFLKLILFRVYFVLLLGGVFVLYLLLKLAARRASGLVAAVMLGAFTLVLFLIHKFPVVNSLWEVEPLKIILAAIGFSYVALRIVEVLRAVCEGRHPPPSLPSTINYLFPFHMLAAGPIQSYDDFVAQPPVPQSPTLLQTLSATERIAWGLFKKFVLAYALQSIFLTGFRVSGWHFLLEVQLFYIWLYLDFSALSDLAVGIGMLLGIATPENFDRPYLARNMINFWERWHISLSQFIRRNLYIPLQLWLVRRGGGRHPLWYSTFAFTISFALCGLWHSGTVRFFLWGLWHAAGLVATNLYRYYLTQRLGAKGVKRYMENGWIRVAATALTFEFVAFSLVFTQVSLERLWP